MTAGQQLYYTVDVTGASIDPGLALFRPNASQHYSRRLDAAVQANANGQGQQETFSYTATTAGWHCLVLWSNNEASGNYTIRIESTPPCPSSEQLTEGSPYIRNTNPGLYWYYHYYSLWSIVGVRPPASSDWNLGLYSDACFTVLKKSSLQGTGQVDFVVSSRSNPQGAYYSKINFVSGNVSESYKVEWWDGDIFPSTFSTNQNWFSNVVRAWDVYLIGGRKYYFGVEMKSGTFPNFDPGAAVFGPSTGTEFYAERSAAIATANSAPYGQREVSSFTPSATGNHALVVWSNNEGIGAYYPIAHEKGDANGDRSLSGADVVKLVNCTFNSDTETNCFLSVADLNCNGYFSGSDIVTEINLVFNGIQPPC